MRLAVVKWLLKAADKEQDPLVKAFIYYRVLKEAGLG